MFWGGGGWLLALVKGGYSIVKFVFKGIEFWEKDRVLSKGLFILLSFI